MTPRSESAFLREKSLLRNLANYELSHPSPFTHPSRREFLLITHNVQCCSAPFAHPSQNPPQSRAQKALVTSARDQHARAGSAARGRRLASPSSLSLFASPLLSLFLSTPSLNPQPSADSAEKNWLARAACRRTLLRTATRSPALIRAHTRC
eukprot:2450228-Rhodomonas_salina.2